jgi:hypothetical protein
MRMLDDSRDQPVDRLWLYLTREELIELVAALKSHADEGHADWHAHVESHHGQGKELTVAVYDPDHPPADEQFRRFIVDDVWPQ